MNKETVRSRIEQIGLIPAIRLGSAADAEFAVESVLSSGIPVAEITLTIPGALRVISDLGARYPELIIGAGTVFTVEDARRAIGAGARFITSPGLNLHVVEFAVQENVTVFPGALTPSEVMAAAGAGADFVKIFPCAPLGGASYIRALLSPFAHIKLIASGGVNQTTAEEYMRSGATALGIGRDLVPPEAVARRQHDWIHELVRRFLHIVQEARGEHGAVAES